MKLIENIKEWWYGLKSDYQTNSNDKLMEKAFPTIIQQEAEDRNSVFNQYNLRCENDFMEVVQVIDIPEEYQLKGQQWQIMDKLNENSYFVTKYLTEQLQLGGNVSVPEYYHVEDPSSGKPFSCRYLAIWYYKPVLKSKKRIYATNATIGGISIGAIATTLLCLL